MRDTQRAMVDALKADCQDAAARGARLSVMPGAVLMLVDIIEAFEGFDDQVEAVRTAAAEAYEDGYDQGHADAHADGAAEDQVCRERGRAEKAEAELARIRGVLKDVMEGRA